MPDVRDNRAEQEFELIVDGERAVAAYQLEGDRIVFTHTAVPPAIEGRGVGSKLVRAALDSVRDRGLRSSRNARSSVPGSTGIPSINTCWHEGRWGLAQLRNLPHIGG